MGFETFLAGALRSAVCIYFAYGSEGDIKLRSSMQIKALK